MERHNDYRMLSRSGKLRKRFDWDSSGRLIVYCVAIGFLTGAAAFFMFAGYGIIGQGVQSVYTAVGIDLPQPADYTADAGPLPGAVFDNAVRKDVFFGLTLPRYWILLILIPTLGGLLCGILVGSFAPDARSDETDMMVKTFHFRNGYLRERIPFVKLIASYFTVCTGGSAGWEGPALLTGSGIASSISRRKGLNGKDRRILFLAGAAGGLGAILQIPFGGALIAVEVLYASTALELSALIPCIVASLTGYSVFRILHIYFYGQPLWTFNLAGEAVIRQPLDWLILLAMVPLIALCGLLFVRIVLEVRNRLFRRMQIPEFIKPAVGGCMLGIIALFCPQVCGSGGNWLNHLLLGQLPFLFVLMLILPKMLATACTLSSGGVGGISIPSLFIGALVGNLLGFGCSYLFQFFGVPAWSPSIPLCTLAGISVFYAGIVKVPFAAALIACEISGDYSLLIPFIALNLVHIAIQSPSASLFEEQVLAPIDSEAHFGTYSVDLLKALTVREALDSTSNVQIPLLTLPVNAAIPQAAALVASRPDTLFPVIEPGNKLAGVVLAEDIWTTFRSRRKWDNVTVIDITQTPDEAGKLKMSVSPDDNLYHSFRLCLLEHISELPVIDPKEPDKLFGMLHQSSIITVYNERLAVSRWN